MNVSLTTELEGFVKSLVEKGDYYSASEVVRDGLRLVKEQEEIRNIRREELRKEVMKGVEDIRSGRSKTFNSSEELFKEITDGGKELLSKHRKEKAE